MSEEMHLTIRPAMPSDAETILYITHTAFTEYANLLGLSQPPAAMLETEQDVVEDIHRKRVLLGFLNMTKAVGSLRYEVRDGIALISRFAILPAWQQSGMGRALMHQAEAELRAAGARAIVLYTGTRLLAQARFYYANGFYVHSVSRKPGYPRGLFVKELVPCKDEDFFSYQED